MGAAMATWTHAWTTVEVGELPVCQPLETVAVTRVIASNHDLDRSIAACYGVVLIREP